MASFEIPDNPEELKSWVENREKELEQEITKGKGLTAEVDSIRDEENELMAKVNELVKRRREIERERDAMRSKVKSEKQAMELAKQKLQTFISEQQLQNELEEKRKKFEELTLNLPWRKHAFSHQIDGASRLATAQRAILGDKRGLGKTLTSIVWLDMIQARKVLVVAPRDILRNFGRELERWAPHRNFVILGGMPKGQREVFLQMCATPAIQDLLLLVNYEAWRRDSSLVVKLAHIGFDTIICDEAHKMKNIETENYKGVRRIIYEDNRCNQCGGKPERVLHSMTARYYTRCSVCLHEPEEFGDFCSVKNVLPMTGTAILNRPQDIFPSLHLIDRVNFPTEGVFLNQYCRVGPDDRWYFKPGGAKQLTARLGMRFVARDEHTAGVEFPPQEITHHYIQWDAEAKALYPKQHLVMEQIRKYGAIKMAEDVSLNVVGILAELTRQRQAVIWPAGIKIKDPDTGVVLFEADAHESIKMDKVMEIAKLVTIEEEDRLILFSKFKEALKEAERRLNEAGISCARYDGDTKEDRRNEIQLDFDVKTAPIHDKNTSCSEKCPHYGKGCEGYKWQVVLCNYETGGVGLNLSAARQSIFMDREWNPGKEDQATGRNNRLDSKKDTIVHVIHVENTIDNFMDALIEYKEEVINDYATEANALEKARQALISGDFNV